METIQEVISTFFSGVWGFFTSVTVPGFGVSLAVVSLGFLFVRLSFGIISLITGFNTGLSGESTRFRTGVAGIRDYKNAQAKKLKREHIGFER